MLWVFSSESLYFFQKDVKLLVADTSFLSCFASELKLVVATVSVFPKGQLLSFIFKRISANI